MKLFFYRKFIRFVIKHFTIVINNTIQMNGGQYIEHMNNYQGKEDECGGGFSLRRPKFSLLMRRTDVVFFPCRKKIAP